MPPTSRVVSSTDPSWAIGPHATRVERPSLLPQTRSGKILRRLLKARELGPPEGELSTLEVGP